jgi:Tfp pilus assembly protein FimT
MIELIIGWTIVGLLIAVALVPILYLLAAVAISIVSLGNMRESNDD